MEDSKKESVASLKEYRLDKYLFVYPANLEYEKNIHVKITAASYLKLKTVDMMFAIIIYWAGGSL
jgi:hypothetical protein